VSNLLNINRKWFIQLHGDHELLGWLTSDNNSKDDLVILEENGNYFMTSLELEKLNSVEEVKKKSIDIIEMINGIASFLFSAKGKLSSNSISNRNKSGGIDCTVFAETCFINISIPLPTIIIENHDGTILKTSPILSINQLLLDARINVNKSKVFRLLAKGNLDWAMLYKLLEVIESDMGDQLFLWVSKTKLKNFKHTCNSINAIGDDSRHGKEVTTPPKKPMTLIESQELINLIIDKYLGFK
jgi:hypothetical protein